MRATKANTLGSKLSSTQWLLGLSAATGAALIWATSAWACVPQPLITLTPSASGPPGAELTVNGFAINGRAEIRWNAIDGALLASADGPAFSVPVRVPQVEEGLYSVLVLERDPSGALGSTGRAAFQVTEEQVSSSTSTEAVSETTSPDPASSDAAVPIGAALAGGAGLLVAGGLGGAMMVRRQRSTVGTPSTSRGTASH